MIRFSPDSSAGKVTLPKQITPMVNGKPAPQEHLAYMNAAEAHMLKILTDGKTNKTQFGPKSFVDPSGAYGGDLSGTQTVANYNGSGPQPNSYSGYSGGYGNYGSYGAASGGGIGSGGSGSSYSSIGNGRGSGSTASSGSSSSGSMGSSGSSGTVGSGKGTAGTGYADKSPAMGGGFGAQAFGNSTTTAQAIAAALAQGLSGGVQTMKPVGGGWSVGPGVNSNQSTVDKSYKPYQDQYPGMSNENVASVPQIPLGAVPQAGKDQSRYPSAPSGAMAANYQAYQNPYATQGNAPLSGPTQTADNSMPSGKAYNMLVNGYGQYPSGQGMAPPPALSGVVGGGGAVAWGPGASTAQAADNGPFNGPETPKNSIDANPQAAADSPPSMYGSNDPTTGQNDSFPVHYGPLHPKNIVGQTIWGAINSAANTPSQPGALLDAAQNGGNISSFGNGRGGDMQAIIRAASQGDPAATAEVKQILNGNKTPWYYPKYSQSNWDTGLPSGLLGGYIG